MNCPSSTMPRHQQQGEGEFQTPHHQSETSGSIREPLHPGLKQTLVDLCSKNQPKHSRVVIFNEG